MTGARGTQGSAAGWIGMAACLLAATVVLDCAGGEERRIRRKLAEIQSLVARTPAESELAALAAARKLARHFTDPFTVVAEPVGLETGDRRRLIGAIHQYRAGGGSLYMRVYDEELIVDPSRERASLFLTVEFVRGVTDLAGAEKYPVTLHWRRVAGEWLIESARIHAPR